MQITYQGNNTAYLPQLQAEIEASSIPVAIDFMEIVEGSLVVGFKTDITPEHRTILDAIVGSHVPSDNSKPSIQSVKWSSPSTEMDEIPYVYNTSKPLGHYVSFQGAGDDMMPLSGDGVGRGSRLSFRLSASQASLSKDFVFNDDVYIKDGYMIVQNAPFGACVDIEIIHPLIGYLFPFGRCIPILGSGWFPLDTEDRAYLPRGMIIRITVHNATGQGDDDQPADFTLFGRFELFRKKPPGT